MNLSHYSEDSILVEESEVGFRLDKLLAHRFPDYSRTYFQMLIEKELVLVNGELIKKGSRLAEGDEIEVEFATTTQTPLQAEPIALDIIYEDNYLLAINKPAGMVVHPAAGNWTHTFVNALLYHCKDLKSDGSLRPGIVHRLDKETSGILLGAKDETTQRRLVAAFAMREMKKEYLAICVGNPGARTISTAIGRHPVRRKEMAVVPGGKEAKTTCETLIHNPPLSLVRLLPYTGRTHQIRVHLQSVGAPILGDKIYGSLAANKKFGALRQFLHAHTLQFTHPITEKSLSLQAPIPDDMQNMIHRFLS